MRNIFEHVLLKLELLIVPIENVVKVGGVSKLTSITHVFLDLYFREFMAVINFPCSKSGLRIGENDVIFSKIPHGLKL